MKKIPTLFHREFQNHHVITISQDVTPGLEWVLAGDGVATEKIDGACCAIIDGVFYKRYDARAKRFSIHSHSGEKQHRRDWSAVYDG